MNINSTFKKAANVATLAALAGVAMANTYSITDLGTFGGAASRGYDVNEQGNVVGWAELGSGEKRAFFYDGATGVKTQIPVFANTLESGAYSLNNANMVVGYNMVEWISNSTRDRAFWWQPGNFLYQIPNFAADSNYEARARAINNDGLVVGEATGRNFSSVWQAFSWTAGGGTVWRSCLTGTNSTQSGLYAVNDFGTMVGFSDDASNNYHGYRITPNGTIIDLGVLTGATEMWMYGLNDSVQMVGSAKIDFNTYVAVRKNNLGATFSLGKLPGSSADDTSNARAINSHGVVVGDCEVGNTNSLAVIHNGVQWQDLNGMFTSRNTWVLRSAMSISDSGYITGWGLKDGVERAFLLKPQQTLHGTIALDSWMGAVAGKVATLHFYDQATNVLKYSANATLNAAGQYSLTTTIQGTYRVTAKVGHWLARNAVPNVTLDSHSSVARDFMLINGDITEDNVVNLDDFLVLASDYEAPVLSEPNSDLTGDGVCNLDDFLVLASSYEVEGD